MIHTSSPEYDIQRQIAADVLAKAGDHAASSKRDIDVSVRQANDFQDKVSVVEQTVQSEVSTALKRIFPTYGFLTDSKEPRETAEFMWVLDPIDGEKNFARGLPLWGLSLALLRKNQAVVGAITIPDNREIYSANLGGNAYRNGEPIKVAKARPLKEAIIAITWGDAPAQRDRMLSAASALVPLANDVLSVGASSIALSWLAAGKVDAVVDNGDLWDFAAGFMIAKQMGAIVTEWDGTRPTYREHDFFTLVSTNQALHDSLVEILKNR